VTDHPVRNPVQPHQCLIPIGDIFEVTPRGQEGLGHRIVDEATRHPSAAKIADRQVVATIEPGEHGVVARLREPRRARPVAHDYSMPECRCRLRETCA
jgi:hypothetical protein